ncbi:MAG: nucleoside triphosphate pyrophosphohydrolase [Deltaproteobacteria bacterium]|jgi:ATP diphosphatase|nr:nucleoside triphosphate pyrophosphohydrolase [Deltaproteobacteria bacterium]
MTLPLALKEVETVLDRLLAPEGCPWDREQTPASLCEYIIEECHELVDAVRHKTAADVREELGDVLFLLLFLSRLYAARGSFSLDEVLKLNAAKMIRRHPHVFAAEACSSRDDLLRQWESIKRREKAEEKAMGGESGGKSGIFAGLPGSLPPMTKAYRIHAKAANADFTWDKDEDVERQVEAEWLELLDALALGDKKAQERELGDMLFTLVELGRRKGIKSAAALDGACWKFMRRFSRMEDLAKERGAEFSSVSMEEKNALWAAVKAEEKESDPQKAESL